MIVGAAILVGGIISSAVMSSTQLATIAQILSFAASVVVYVVIQRKHSRDLEKKTRAAPLSGPGVPSSPSAI
jgi:membrane protein implicated in regulation of membrane protease activity